MPLTDKQIKHAKPDPLKRLEHPAGPPPGLYLIVHPSGAKSWALRYRWLGRPAKLTFKRYPDMSLAQARAEAEAALERLRSGENPAASYAAEERGPHGAEQVAEEWLTRAVKPDSAGKVRVKTWREVERVTRREILPLCKHKVISQIGRADIMRRLDSIVDRGAPIAANETLSILKRWFNWCIERGYLEASPAAAIKPPGRRESRDRVLTPEELAEVWTAIGKLAYPWGPFLQVLILTAQRRGEVAEMRWQDVDLDKKLWTLGAEQTKAGRVHDVPLTPAVLAILHGLPRFTGPYMFTTRGGAKPINSFSKCKAMLDAAIAKQKPKSLAPFTAHDFRRTATSWLAKSNVPPHVLSALLNHSPGSTMGVTAIYNRFRYLDERREALEQWAKHVLSLRRVKASAKSA